MLEDLMECELPNTKLAAAKDVLDRVGFPAIKELKICQALKHLN